MEFDCVMVWSTIGSRADVQKVAASLVAERLAACVNVLGEMESVYRWKGKVEIDRERQMIMKTTAARVPALKTRLHQLHDYDVPEFICVPIVDGSDAYLQWIRESVSE